MTRAARRIAALIAALALVALGVQLLRAQPTPARAAPPLPASALHDPDVSIATLRGRAVLVNYWASWCGPCAREAPQLAAFAHGHPGVRLVAVDTGDDARRARAFVRRHGWAFPVLRDADGAAAEAYDVRGLPTTFAISADGRIVRTLRGPQTVRSLDEALAAAG